MAPGEIEIAAAPVGRRPGTPRRDFEELVVIEVLVLADLHLCDDEAIALLDHRHDHGGEVGAVGRKQEIDPIDVEQLGVDAGNRGRFKLPVVVKDDELDRPAEQTARGVHVAAPELERCQSRFAPRRDTAGLRDAKSDADRLVSGMSENGGRCHRRRRGGRGRLANVLLVIGRIVVSLDLASSNPPEGRRAFFIEFRRAPTSHRVS